MEQKKEIIKRKKIISNAISLYSNKEYDELISKFENKVCKYKDYDDPYFLGYLYALLVLSFININKKSENKEYHCKIVKYMNKILIISGVSLFEYTGNYSPLSDTYKTNLYSSYDLCIKEKNVEAMWGKARLLTCIDKKYDEAEVLFKKAIETDDQNYLTYCMYARLYEAEFKYDKSVEMFKKAIDISPNETLAYQMLAYIKQKQYEYDEAESLFNAAISKDNKDSRSFLRLSYLYYYNDNSKWEESIKTAIKKSPLNTKCKTVLADFYYETDKCKEALDVYNEALETNEYCGMALRNRAFIKGIENFEDASKDLKKAVRQNKFDSTAYSYYIQLICNQKTIENDFSIKKWCKSLLKRFDKYCKYDVYQKCQLNYFIENYEFDIVDTCKKELTKDKYNLDLYLLLSKLYVIIGDYGQAIKILESFFDIDSMNYDVFSRLVVLEQYERNYEKALHYLEEFPISKKQDFLYKYEKIYLKMLLHNYNENYNENFRSGLESLFSSKLKINDADLFCSGELAFQLHLYDIAKKFFNKIDNRNSVEFKLSEIFKKVISVLENEDENCEFDTSFFKNKMPFNLIFELIYIFADEIPIDLLKSIFVDNIEFEDTDFSKILKVNRDNKLLRELWFWECTLLSLLTYKHFSKGHKYVSHYTSLKVLDNIILSENPEKNVNKNFHGKLRFSTIVQANDPEEGKVLNKILNKINSNHCTNFKDSSKKLNDFAILQTSMTLCEDSLTMFRLYGKKENIEGTGANIVFKNTYFSLVPKQMFEKNSGRKNQVIDNQDKKNVDLPFHREKKPLHWILYYDEKNQLLTFNPISKYKANIISLNEADMKKYKWHLLKEPICESLCNDECHHEDACNAIKNYYDYLCDNIGYVINKIAETIENIDSDKNASELVPFVEPLLSYIKYLFKDEAFSDEQELRMISLAEMGNKKINSFGNKLYIDYFPNSDYGYNYLEKIILGPNVENCDVMVEYYKHISALSGKNIDVYKSHAPLFVKN